ncbi:MAG TPA: protein kinase [Kofleriaceae bacterium]|nr:protein kinase [Kofleriaceae bacterium]
MTADAATCLDDNEVTAFVSRRMSAGSRARVIAHLDQCELCMTITSAAAGSGDDDAPRPAASVAASDAANVAASDAPRPANVAASDAANVAATDPGVAATDPGEAVARGARIAATADGSGGIATSAAMDATVPVGTASPVRLPRGERIAGRYTLVSMIGEGAMGVVYVADDPQLDRKVALKIVRAGRFSQREARARLSREARAMAQVKHPNVVTVYDAGELDDGVFIAMELVTGETLADWLRRDRPWRDVIGVFAAAGRGLSAAHIAGLVHRDFKPENVLVDRDDRACVTDFGLAFAPASASPLPAEVAGIPLRDAGALTRTGALVGTPLYMSPEQHRGERVDARSDQYSFAVALYIALYGTAPFGGATVGELRASVLDGGRPPRPSGTPVPVRVHRVLSRALAAHPGARYPSIERMLDALTVAARPAWWRRPWGAALAAGAAACLVAGAAALAMASHGAPEPVAGAGAGPAAGSSAGPTAKPPRLVVMVGPLDNQSGEPRLDGAAELQLAAVLARSTQIDAASGMELHQKMIQLGIQNGSLDDTGRALHASDGRSSLVIGGTIERAGAGLSVMVTARDPQGVRRPFALREPAATTEDVLAAMVRIGEAVRVQLGDDVAHDHPQPFTRSLDAMHELLTGKQLAADGQFDAAYPHLKRAVAADPACSVAHMQLGGALYNLSHLPEAQVEYERALEDRDTMPERQRLALLGDYLDTTGRYLESVAAYEQLLAKWPGDIRTEINVVSTALNGASWQLALELARRAAADHGNVPVTRANLVLAELANNRFTDAVHDGGAMIGELPHSTPFGIAGVMIAYTLTGDGAAAERTIDQLAAADPGLGADARIDLRMFQGRLADAEALLATQIETVRHSDGQDPRFALSTLARLQLRRGEPAAARRTALQAVGMETVRNAYVVASVLCETGDDHVARELAHTWSGSSMPEWRMFGKLLEGDVARAHGDLRGAIAAYNDASRLHDLWPVHARLGLALLAAGQLDDATRELAMCVARRGEAAVFLTPSLSYLPEIYLALARAKDAAHDPGALDAYRAVVALGPEAQGDPVTDAARQRIAALAPAGPGAPRVPGTP